MNQSALKILLAPSPKSALRWHSDAEIGKRRDLRDWPCSACLSPRYQNTSNYIRGRVVLLLRGNRGSMKTNSPSASTFLRSEHNLSRHGTNQFPFLMSDCLCSDKDVRRRQRKRWHFEACWALHASKGWQWCGVTFRASPALLTCPHNNGSVSEFEFLLILYSFSMSSLMKWVGAQFISRWQ